MRVKCVIFGKPMPWKRARSKKNQRFTDPAWASYGVTASWSMVVGLRAAGGSRPLFASGSVRIEVDAIWPCGKEGVRKKLPLRWKPTRPDGDNVLKGLADVSQGILVVDDGQYADQRVRCFYDAWDGPGPRVIVCVSSIEGEVPCL